MRTPATSAMRGATYKRARSGICEATHTHIPSARVRFLSNGNMCFPNICFHTLQLACLVLHRGARTRTTTRPTPAWVTRLRLRQLSSRMTLVHGYQILYKLCFARERSSHYNLQVQSLRQSTAAAYYSPMRGSVPFLNPNHT